MKKLVYWIGAFVSLAAICTAIAVFLKKLKISLSIEGIDENLEDTENSDINVSIEGEEKLEEKAKEITDKIEKAKKFVKESESDIFDHLFEEKPDDEIEVEISKED